MQVLNFVQQVFFLLSTEGSLVITRAYPDLYLGGTPSQETVTGPPSCLLLENRLYMTTKTKFPRLNNFVTYFKLQAFVVWSGYLTS